MSPSVAADATAPTRASLFADAGFRRLFAADALSQAASRIGTLALPLVAITGLGSSAVEVGILSACQVIPFLVVGLPAGAWVDRMRRRPVMIAADVVRGAALLSVPATWWLGGLTVWQLYTVALVSGTSTVFFDVGYQSYLPYLVGRGRLVEANARLQAIASVASVGGPSLGGLLIQAITAPTPSASTPRASCSRVPSSAAYAGPSPGR